MKMKNDCERDYIKEAFDKLYNCVMPYIDLTQFTDADTAFKELDRKVHSEIYILKKKLNNERKHGEDLADVNCRLSSENVDLKARLTLFENSRITWRSRAQHAEKEVEDLNKKISELEEELAQARNSTEPHLMEENDRLREIVNTLEKEINDLKKKIQHLEIENANLRVTPADANAIEVLKRENRVLRCDNKKLAAACEDNKRLRIVIGELEKENASLRVTVTPFDILESLKKENSELKTRNERLNTKSKSYLKDLFEARIEAAQYKKNNVRQRADIDTLENEINSLKKKIHELEQETADDAIRIKSLERANSVLRGDNKILWSKLEECDIPKREQASYKSLVEAIEFQNKKIEELEAEKARLKEECDVHETTFKKLEENVDLSYGHEFEFGDEVFVPWSCDPYMYIKSGQLYNPKTKRLVYVGKDQHLKWFREKFAIV